MSTSRGVRPSAGRFLRWSLYPLARGAVSKGATGLRGARQVIDPPLMLRAHQRLKQGPDQPDHGSALRFLAVDVRASLPIVGEHPRVVTVRAHPAAGEREPLERFELRDSGSTRRAECDPGEFAAQRDLRPRPTGRARAARVAVVGGPLVGTDKP